MKAEIISIGTELLMGELTDTNAAWIAGRLAARLGLDRATARQAAIATWRTDLHDTALRAIPGYSPRADAMTHSFDGQEFSPSLQE